MTLLFDFDGTIIDISNKYYAVYSAFVRERGGTSLSKRQYWDLKRSAASHDEILQASQLDRTSPEDMKRHIRNNIELEEYLRYDSIFDGAGEILREVAEAHPCYLVSMRRNPLMFQKQIEWLGLRDYFKETITPGNFAEDPDASVVTPKGELLRRLKIASPAVIIGDSGMDIITGQQLGITTCAVTTGIRDRKVLEGYAPDFIIEGLREIREIMINVAGG